MNARRFSAALCIRAGLAAAVLSVALAGCGPSCDDACENVATICDADFKEAEIVFSVEACVESCDSNQAGCANIDEETACVASAAKCSDVAGCTRCQ